MSSKLKSYKNNIIKIHALVFKIILNSESNDECIGFTIIYFLSFYACILYIVYTLFRAVKIKVSLWYNGFRFEIFPN